ncbi:GON-4-like protein [Gadus macrocephalus]|uniref:GON-4-like protein n=1 Tax=Gadus macrocephalus TaxID=80720 RepID=UPI0028CB2AF3|nr:GON-4-like protein [Gadus macrocephalus]XP_059899907.1 GON-4-like protein [Gadus macrocephalus]
MNPERKRVKITPHNALQQSPGSSHNLLQQSPGSSHNALQQSPGSSHNALQQSPGSSHNALQQSPGSSHNALQQSPGSSHNALQQSPGSSHNALQQSPGSSHDALQQSPGSSHNALQQSPGSTHNALQQSPEEEEENLLVEEDTTDSSLVITMDRVGGPAGGGRARGEKRRRSKMTSDSEEEAEPRLEMDRLLDQSLETKSRHHKLTAVNVKNILHEVITNEHVVAMMKAALNETEAVPPFEPKMTRSKLKEVVERGVVIPAWNMSPIKKASEVKAPQFVDIHLAEEDSSDEEYHPEDDEEDETAEDTFQESDMESTASSPRGTRIHETARSKRRRAESISMGPPPPPQAPPTNPVTDSSFLEKLHAVEEELSCMEPYQLLEDNLMAYRTRSKRPLRNVPLGSPGGWSFGPLTSRLTCTT